MDERSAAWMYLEEMRGLLGVLRQHLDALSVGVSPERQTLAADAMTQLARAAADLSADFRAEDCAALTAAMARVFAAGASGVVANPDLLAAVADTLTYLRARVDRMAVAQHVLAPGESERASAARMLALLAAASDEVGAASLPGVAPLHTPAPSRPITPRSGADAGGVLTPDDLAILDAFRAGSLRPQASASRPTAPPMAGGDAARDDEITLEMRATFLFETRQDIQELRSAAMALEQAPGELEWLSTLSRIAHKIKGNAGTVSLRILPELAHMFEDQVDALRARRVAIRPDAITLVLRGVGELESTLEGLAAERAEDPDALARMRELTRGLLALPPPGGERAESPRATPITGPRLTAPPIGLTPARLIPSDGPALAPAGAPAAAGAGTTTRRDSGGFATGQGDGESGPHRAPRFGGTESLLKVDLRRVDVVMSHVNAMAINRAETAQARRHAWVAQEELDRAVARLDELSERFAVFAPATETPSPSPLGSGAGTSGGYIAPPASGALAERGHTPSGGLSFARRGTTVPPEIAERRTGSRTPEGRTGEWDELELAPSSERDDFLRALSETIADVETNSAALRGVLRQLDRLDESRQSVTSAIQRAITQVRLVPLNDLVLGLQVAARNLSLQLGKDVAFLADFGDIEMDRDVSDGLAEPLLQLVRNAIAHGIEPPEERSETGKPAVGHVSVRAAYVGNEVEIEIGDDGRGVNPSHVTAAAVMAGIVDPGTARALSPDGALRLIFEQGLSTAGVPTSAAGRGTGLAAVRAELDRLRGSIQVRATAGHGTTFVVRVPVSLSMVHALHVRAAGQSYALPFAAIRQSIALPTTPDPVDPSQVSLPRYVTVRLEEGEAKLRVHTLAELLGYRAVDAVPAVPRIGLVVDFGRGPAIVAVEAMEGDGEIVVRRLSPHLRRRAVRGASVTPAGEVLLLLDMTELAARSGDSTLTGPLRPAPRPPVATGPVVLVVDDSLTIRRAIEAALTRAGCIVEVARDGMEALERMLAIVPRVLILDIEMPNLNGFDLLRTLRAQEQYAGIRVAMLTSRGSARHRRHAMELGADAYLVKPCPEEELVATVRGLLARPE